MGRECYTWTGNSLRSWGWSPFRRPLRRRGLSFRRSTWGCGTRRTSSCPMGLCWRVPRLLPLGPVNNPPTPPRRRLLICLGYPRPLRSLIGQLLQCLSRGGLIALRWIRSDAFQVLNFIIRIYVNLVSSLCFEIYGLFILVLCFPQICFSSNRILDVFCRLNTWTENT